MNLEEHKRYTWVPKLFEAAFYLVIAISFAVGVVWWNEGPPMVVVERHLMTPEVRPGGQLRVLNLVVATKACPVDVYRTVVDSHGVRHELEVETLWPDEEIGRFEYVSAVTVPEYVHVGTALYRVRAEWQCNPLQAMSPREVKFSGVEFEVVK